MTGSREPQFVEQLGCVIGVALTAAVPATGITLAQAMGLGIWPTIAFCAWLFVLTGIVAMRRYMARTAGQRD